MTAASAGLDQPLTRDPKVLLMAVGHGAIHWIAASWYLLLPFIRDDLGLSYSEVGILASLFHVSSLAANFPSGTAVDVTARRVFFQVLALTVGAAGLLLTGFATGYALVATMVVLIGATNMLWHPAAITFLSIHFPKRRGAVLSIHALGANLGDALAPLAAGAMLVGMTWQTTAMLNAVPALLVAAVIMLVLGRFDRERSGDSQPQTVRDYLGGMGLLLRRREVWTLAIMSGFRSITHSGLLAFLPLYLADVLKVNPFMMGLALTLLQVGGAIAAPIAGIASDRVGRRRVVMAGLWGTTILAVALTFVSDPLVYIAGVSILGFCLYAIRPVIHSWAMDISPPNLGGSMTSLLFAAQSSLNALTPLIGGFLADAFGLVSVFYFLAVTMVIANMLTFLVPEEAPKPAPAA